MRSWHKKLLPYLCSKHLVACWRECLGMYDIILNDRKGYRNHPATKEYENCPDRLWVYLQSVRKEMLRRGYNPKEMPIKCKKTNKRKKQWQSLEEQIERLKEKRKTIPSCKCKIENLDKLIK